MRTSSGIVAPLLPRPWGQDAPKLPSFLMAGATDCNRQIRPQAPQRPVPRSHSSKFTPGPRAPRGPTELGGTFSDHSEQHSVRRLTVYPRLLVPLDSPQLL